MPSAKREPVPEFPSEDGERQFWAEHDSTEFIDWQSAQRRKFPNLKPTLRTISLRLPVSMIEDPKVLANKKDVPYQSLLKVFRAERLGKGASARITGNRALQGDYREAHFHWSNPAFHAPLPVLS